MEPQPHECANQFEILKTDRAVVNAVESEIEDNPDENLEGECEVIKIHFCKQKNIKKYYQTNIWQISLKLFRFTKNIGEIFIKKYQLLQIMVFKTH